MIGSPTYPPHNIKTTLRMVHHVNGDRAERTAIVIAGPTAVGKTSVAIEVAERLGCEIVSADSRQIYSEMCIGTAVPSVEELRRVRHHFIQSRSIANPYTAYDFEHDTLALLPDLFARCGGRAVVCGGSMMYVGALCNGIDDMPTVSNEVRESVHSEFDAHGLGHIQRRLKDLDPTYYAQAEASDELQNPRRVMHAIEVSLQAGVPYSTLCTGESKSRNFGIVKIALVRDREELYRRIEARVDQMMALGLLEEVKRLMPQRGLTTLDTVGYRELFAHLEGKISLDEAVRQIKRNTRHYAKKQLTWIKGDKTYNVLNISGKSQSEVVEEVLRIERGN